MQKMSYNNSLHGSNKFWNADMNDSGFMGFVDKWWIFWSRIGTIMMFVFLIPIIIISIVVIAMGSKESFGTSRLRYQNRRYN